MKYKFKAKDKKTGEWVEGDLVYITQRIYHNSKDYNKRGFSFKEVPMIVKLSAVGGRIFTNKRYFVDESTIELIKDEKD